MSEAAKVTYATLSADSEELQAKLDAAFGQARRELGRDLPLYVGGVARTRDTFESTSPADTRVVVARATSGTAEDARDAVAAAKAEFPAWRATPWKERAAIIDRAASIVRDRRFELSAWLVLEMGKSRLEALGEIEELADLFNYYTEQLRQNEGYERPMGRLAPSDRNTSTLRPYGVWVVVAPWNFPYALLGAPMAAALLAGNTVVAKPSSETPLSGVKVAEILLEAGVPPGAVSLVTGGGSVVGDALAGSPDVGGLTFTGSYEVGFSQLYRRFSGAYPKPCIAEMGGKNPAIVMESADLDRAVAGVYRSAFGMNGHKCSACSRVYVHEKVAPEFLRRLVKVTEETRIGDPSDRASFLGPVATAASFRDYQRYVAMARQDGEVLTGGDIITDDVRANGYFVRPTIVTGLSNEHYLIREELFVPILHVQTIRDLDQALELANDTRFGLTAGLFSTKEQEVDAFLNRIEAGVVYVNRAAGATTGAWPGVQPFGGWKGSGSTGKNIGGHYTLPCYMREQSRTVSG